MLMDNSSHGRKNLKALRWKTQLVKCIFSKKTLHLLLSIICCLCLYISKLQGILGSPWGALLCPECCLVVLASRRQVDRELGCWDRSGQWYGVDRGRVSAPAGHSTGNTGGPSIHSPHCRQSEHSLSTPVLQEVKTNTINNQPYNCY